MPPLAEKLRPKNLDEIVGQKHILGKNGLLVKLTESQNMPSMIFYGPPGTGKTTAAQIISQKTNKRFYKLNATTASLADIKNIISEINPITAPNGVLLYLDEVQYFNKKQQQSLLEFMENGKITLIASTTENPYFYVYNAILSRSQVFEFKKVSCEEIFEALLRASEFLEKENNIKIKTEPEVLKEIAAASAGDVRRAINIFEMCFSACKEIRGKKTIKKDDILKELIENSFSGYNKTGDEHYDLLSAFQKSMRGSDPNASVYYLAALLEAGELISVCRRLLVCACEDVGLAYPNILPIIKSLTDTALQVGMPEARIPLADAVILTALSPKSNSAYKAVNIAANDIKKYGTQEIPRHLKNVHCDSQGVDKKALEKYKYPHDFKNSYVNQQYLPNSIKNKKYYYPQPNKNETAFKNYWEQTTKQELANGK